MKKLRNLAIFAVIGAFALTGCGQSGTPEAESGAEEPTAAAPEYSVASDVDLKDSPTWEKADSAGKIRIGVKYDQPGLGNKKAGSDAPEGFDVEIAKMIAASLGFSADQIEWSEAQSANRELFLKNGQVDLIVATYTINDERKQQVDFAGPYYIAGQDLLVKADSDIAGPEDLAGKKVCSVDGSTPAKRIADEYPDAELEQLGGYSECVTKLESGETDAVTTDDAILRGYAKQYGDQFKVVGKPFSEEPYGVGLPKGDDALRNAVNDALEAGAKDGTWKKAFEYTLGSSDGVTAPEVDRY
ncbi:glutamate ABC transporter substrate-binding protein [Saxibacter everestensis]|uniref:Glutamate ABC transporter substrate-binding protein n=1 Tax=Saxibacter everestensis TaxID=2909229 RepID=A0ABY8QVX6_9MICO|nr:glutamate ABC transporter substrate-binding protein [Brevibacteriaceae bacterium ZFBP1038]